VAGMRGVDDHAAATASGPPSPHSSDRRRGRMIDEKIMTRPVVRNFVRRVYSGVLQFFTDATSFNM